MTFDEWKASPYTAVIEQSIAIDYVPKSDLESLRQQLADHIKREVMLRDGLKRADDLLRTSYDHVSPLIREAIAATADLENVRLCEKEPAAIVYLDYGGDGAVLQTKLADDEPLYRAWEPKP